MFFIDRVFACTALSAGKLSGGGEEGRQGGGEGGIEHKRKLRSGYLAMRIVSIGKGMSILWYGGMDMGRL